MYTITPMPKRNLVEVIFAGEYGRAHDEFHAGMIEAAKAAQAHDGAFDILVDMTEAPVMPLDRTGPSSKILQGALPADCATGPSLTR